MSEDNKKAAASAVVRGFIPGWLSIFLMFSFIQGCCSGGCSDGYARTGEHVGILVKAVKSALNGEGA